MEYPYGGYEIFKQRKMISGQAAKNCLTKTVRIPGGVKVNGKFIRRLL